MNMSSDLGKMIALPANMEENQGNFIQTENSEMNLNNSSENKLKTRTRNRRDSPIEKLNNIMKILLKLAKINAYDITGRVRDKNGVFLNDSDLISLINHAMTHGKLLLGQSEFIRLLHEANVEPNLIINENIRAKLLNIYSGNPDPDDDDYRYRKPSKPKSSKTEADANKKRDRKSLKRKRSQSVEKFEDPVIKNITEEVEEEEPRKKRRIWETLDENTNEDMPLEENQSESTINEWESNPHN